MSIVASNYIWQNARTLSNQALIVGLAIADCHNDQTGQCNPGFKKISKKIGRSNPIIAQAIAELEASGVILVERRKGKGGNLSNVYTFPGCKVWEGSNPDLTTPSNPGLTSPSNPLLTSTGIQPEGEPELEVPLERTAPSASAGGTPQGQTGETPQGKKEVEQLTRDYYPNWVTSRPARVAVYCKLGRKHFPGNPYFAPDKVFMPHHLNVLDDLFDQWDVWSADVFDHVFENWSEIRSARRVTPTLVALDAIEDWHPIIEDYKLARRRKNHAAMIARVEKLAAPQPKFALPASYKAA